MAERTALPGDWVELVARTRLLVRSLGLTELDDGAVHPERLCGRETRFTHQRVGADLHRPEDFRNYLYAALDLLSPLRLETAKDLVDGLNAQLEEELTELKVQTPDGQIDLLSPEPYRVFEVASRALEDVLRLLGWFMEPGPGSPSDLQPTPSSSGKRRRFGP